MRIIPKMQMGGKSTAQFASFTPFIPQQAAPAQQQAAPASSASSSGGGIPKELTSLLNKLDGLPNEMAQLSQAVQGMMAMADLYGGGQGDLGSISSQYAQIQVAIQTANWNKKEYDKAYNQVVKNQGLNEIAINEDGSIYAFNKDKKLVNISIQEYLKNKEDYIPQTNSNLLWLRARDPQFIDNNLILNTVSNGIGMKEVVTQINQNLRTLGSTTEELNGYVKKSGSQVESGIQALEKLANSGQKAAVDGIYKVKSKNVNSQKQMEAAISAIYQSLTPNAQALLMLKSGDAKNPTKAALNLISQKVMQIMNNTVSYDELYDHGFDETGKPIPKGKSGSNGKDDFKQNAAMMFLNGSGYTQDVEMKLGGNDSRTITAITNVIPGSDNKPFEGKYLEELRVSGMSGVLDLNNASMGGYKIAIPDQVELTDNQMHLIWWPANADGTPNLDAADTDALRSANEEIAQHQLNPDSPEAQAIMEKHGIRDIANLKQFVVINAMTSNKALGVDRFDSTPLLETVGDSVANAYEERYKSYWSKDKAKARSMDLDHFHWINPNDWFGGYDDIYKGLVWIPVMNNWANAMAGTGEHVKTEDVVDYDARQQAWDADIRAQQQYINPADYE